MVATSNTVLKPKKSKVSRPSVLDKRELSVIGRIGKDLATLSEEGQQRVIAYFAGSILSNGESDD